MIKAILFDLGGVLFTNGTKLLAQHISTKHNKDVDEVYSLLNSSDIGNAYREGKITRDTFWDGVKEQLEIKDDTDELEATWISMYEMYEDTKQIIALLRKKYNIYFLSDNTKERITALDSKFAFTKLFHGGVFSHELGVRKPNPEMYERSLKKLGLTPEEVLFIDDKDINLPPAEKLGMKTILFTKPEELLEDLKRMHLV